MAAASLDRPRPARAAAARRCVCLAATCLERPGVEPLARLLYGRDLPAPDGAAPAGRAAVPLDVLDGSLREDRWIAAGEVRREVQGEFEVAAASEMLFGWAAAPALRPGELEAATAAIYDRLLLTVEQQGFPHLLRIWNYVPRINEDEGGMERYRRFCSARSLAFERRYGPAFTARVPAGTAVGGDDARLVVHFLAGRTPGRHLENPRQVSAWAYPPLYGPRPPAFARATVVPAGEGSVVFVAGTASVVGHESLHPGDPARQTDETLRNIRTVLEEADGASPRGNGALERLTALTAFVRRPEDLPAIRKRLRAEVGGGVPVRYLRADICRADLLVEIEGLARL